MVWFVLGHSGQRTSVKCAEAAWNYKSGGVVHLKSPAGFVCVCVWVCVCVCVGGGVGVGGCVCVCVCVCKYIKVQI